MRRPRAAAFPDLPIAAGSGRLARLGSRWFALVVLSVVIAACAEAPESPTPSVGGGEPGADAGPVTAFVGVTVIPMDGERVVPGQTVVVRGGRISEMGSMMEVDVPAGATQVDGRGKFLMPGVAEMHGHYPNPEQAEFTEAVLFLYVANGVTLVRGMQGNASHLPLRDAIEAGEIVGPRLFVCAPSMSGNSVQTVADAERLVREAQAAGFDHLKVHEGLTPEVYAAIASTANEVGITFSGHVSNLVGLYSALQQGQTTIDHLDNFIEAMIDDREAVEAAGLFDLPALVSQIDESKIGEVVAATVEAGAGVVPTEVLWETFLGGRTGEEMIATRPELRYWLPEGRQGLGQGVTQWSEQAGQRRAALPSPDAGQPVIELRRRLIRELHDAGVPVLLGTDSPQVFSVPGFSIHHEMRVMVESGLTPYEVLHSGTKAVADFYGAGDFGTVAPGQRADLVLLNANPLEDVTNFADNAGVMANGRWIPRAEIDARLAEIEAMMATGG
jgi:imidazolonepropionase-like amidohydrolase